MAEEDRPDSTGVDHRGAEEVRRKAEAAEGGHTTLLRQNAMLEQAVQVPLDAALDEAELDDAVKFDAVQPVDYKSSRAARVGG